MPRDERTERGLAVARRMQGLGATNALEARVAALERQMRDLQATSVSVEWLSQPAAARVAGVSVGTIRMWQRQGFLSRGRRSRVAAAELRAFLAGGVGLAPHQVADLAGVARAREAARQILGWPEKGAKPAPSPGAR